jgi:hypothetical protein
VWQRGIGLSWATAPLTGPTDSIRTSSSPPRAPGGQCQVWPVAEVRLALNGQEVTAPCFTVPHGPPLLGTVALEILSSRWARWRGAQCRSMGSWGRPRPIASHILPARRPAPPPPPGAPRQAPPTAPPERLLLRVGDDVSRRWLTMPPASEGVGEGMLGLRGRSEDGGVLIPLPAGSAAAGSSTEPRRRPDPAR